MPRARSLIAAAAGALLVSACAYLQGLSLPSAGGGMRTLARASLQPVDAATNLISWGVLATELSTPQAPPEDGQDPLIVLTLTRPDGKVMTFEAANHTPMDLATQAPGGPLAQAMGFFGDEAPKLYHARGVPAGQEPFMCAPAGPRSIGVHEAEGGAVTIVGLSGGFEFDTRDDGTFDPLPASPNLVCARMRFTRTSPQPAQ